MIQGKTIEQWKTIIKEVAAANKRGITVNDYLASKGMKHWGYYVAWKQIYGKAKGHKKVPKTKVKSGGSFVKFIPENNSKVIVTFNGATLAVDPKDLKVVLVAIKEAQ